MWILLTQNDENTDLCGDMDSLLNMDYEGNMEKNGQMLKLDTSATSHQKNNKENVKTF